MRLFGTALALILAGNGHAAEVTDMPLELQGALGVTYGGFAEWGALEESSVNIGQRRISRHDLLWDLEFAPVDGMALRVSLDQTAALTYSYPSSRTMLLEPVDGGGTYLLDSATQDDSTSGSGLNGVWIGAAFSPFNERYDRGQKSTWRLDGAFRTGSASKNLWVAKDGKRGSAPGGTALRFTLATSQDLGAGNPWIQLNYQRENPFTADLVDESGTVWATGVDLQPASTMSARAGCEVVTSTDEDMQSRYAVDFYLGFDYRTWEDVASGVYLPNVLDAGRQIAMTHGERIDARGGIAVDFQFNSHVRARTGPEVVVHTPVLLEHSYNVMTRPANLGIAWSFTLDGLAQIQKGDPKADALD